jgi:hypothetical protein
LKSILFKNMTSTPFTCNKLNFNRGGRLSFMAKGKALFALSKSAGSKGHLINSHHSRFLDDRFNRVATTYLLCHCSDDLHCKEYENTASNKTYVLVISCLFTVNLKCSYFRRMSYFHKRRGALCRDILILGYMVY